VSKDTPDGVTEVLADTDGTVYLSPEPGAEPFVVEGAEIQEKATLALIEVMKTFTPVRCETAGRIEKILVTDGDAVTAGQPLLWVRK
jgi:acetyl-CoA carboxylase biotin carboxyl carrier protein